MLHGTRHGAVKLCRQAITRSFLWEPPFFSARHFSFSHHLVRIVSEAVECRIGDFTIEQITHSVMCHLLVSKIVCRFCLPLYCRWSTVFKHIRWWPNMIAQPKMAGRFFLGASSKVRGAQEISVSCFVTLVSCDENVFFVKWRIQPGLLNSRK